MLQKSHHSSDTHGLDDNSLLMSTTVHTLLITKCVGRARSLVSLVHRRHGFEAWRVLKEEYEGKGENRIAALLRGILNPRARREKMYREGRDFGDMLAHCEKDVAQYRVAAGADLQQAVHAATVMEHAAAAYRDFLNVVGDLPSLACVRARVATGTVELQRSWATLHSTHVGTDTSGKQKALKQRARKARKEEERRKAKARETKVNRRRETIPMLLASVDIVASGITRHLSAGG